jgi:nucleoside-diphosphate-sugar epimerase
MDRAMAGRTVLVTGATGTVGSVVVRHLLAAGARVKAMVRRDGATVDGATTVRGELRDPASLRAAVAGCELVVHTAADLSFDPVASQAVNVDAVRDLCLAMRAEGCARLVHISTVSVYDYRRGLDFDEESPMWSEMREVYGFTKAEGERAIRASGVPATILRPVMVLSTHPRSYWGPLAFERARKLPEPVMPLAEVPHVHVDNLATAVELAATRERALGRAYDVIDGSGEARQFLDVVYGAIGRPVPELPPDAPRATFAGRRIRDELGYAPADRWAEFLRELAAVGRA